MGDPRTLSTRPVSPADENTRLHSEDGGILSQADIPAIVRRRQHILLAAEDSRNPKFADHVCSDTSGAADLATAVEDLAAVGGEVEIAGGTYPWTEQVTINKDNAVVFGHGQSTLIQPVAGFANDTFALSFYYNINRPLTRCQVRNLRISGDGISTYTNTVHGLDFCVERGLIEDVFVQNMSGNGVQIRQVVGWSNKETRIERLQVERCANYGIYAPGVSDQHWHAMVVHDSGVANLYATSSLGGTMVSDSHFWGGNANRLSQLTQHNLHFVGGASWLSFDNCKFEHGALENTLFDATNTGGVNLAFLGCRWRNGGASAANTYSQLRFKRDSGGDYFTVTVDDGCAFVADNTQPKYNIEFDGSLQFSRIGVCRMNNAVTGKHTALGAVNGKRTTIKNRGWNSTDPNSGGDWQGVGEWGLRVYAADTGKLWEANDASSWDLLT